MASKAIQDAMSWRRGLTGAALVLGVGLVFWFTRLGDGLQNLSYDFQFLVKPAVVPTEAVIVYIDAKSCQELQQDPKSWDRALHAQLLDRLTADGARLVVFDIVFDKLRDTKSDDALVRAIKVNGKVVLAAVEDTEAHQDAVGASLIQPVEKFLAASAGWGIAALETETVKRRFRPVHTLGPNLAYTAALLAGGRPRSESPATNAVFWLNYYGPQGTIANLSFCEVKDQPAGFFRDKVVFVGGRPATPDLFDEAEENQTPLTRWGGNFFPGVEILTTAFLNLHRGELLSRLPGALEWLVLAGAGLVLGFGLAAFRPRLAAAIGLGGAALAAVWLVWLCARQQVWFPWTLIFLVQLPTALVWSVYGRMVRRRETIAPTPAAVIPAPPRVPPRVPPQVEAPTVVEVTRTAHGTALAPVIPDHKLLRSVGTGAYGSVWLAQNAVGMYRAVKVVYRSAFEVEDPYEREFRGITKFMPISLSHPKLVHLLHVGRNDAAGYFFYIMEAADDEVSGQQIEPTTYSPRSLSREINRRKRLPALECLDLGIELAAALDFLHRNQLIHRDIKPANIIYVGGVPKMADIGLVTDISSKPEDTSYVGTQGFIPPEGPGTAMGDVYSLGKVLYQAATGLRIDDFPLLPTTLVNKADDVALLGMNHIILRACENKVAERFQTAAELKAALEQLKRDLLGSAA